MDSPVDVWLAEHRDFERLLALVDGQLAVFREGGTPNYALMRDAVQYLRHFPDRHHHAREDIVFRRLAERDPGIRPLLLRLEQEHRVIGSAGEALLRCLNEIANDAWIARAEVESAAATYLAYYMKHIEDEDRNVLSLARKLLTPEDWAAISAAHPPGRDPLFGEAADPRFRELRRQISAEMQA
jgi:hemerythrin-like domain-containing protein